MKFPVSPNVQGPGGAIEVESESSGGDASGAVAVTSGASASPIGGVAIATYSSSSMRGDVKAKGGGGVSMSGLVRVASGSAKSAPETIVAAGAASVGSSRSSTSLLSDALSNSAGGSVTVLCG